MFGFEALRARALNGAMSKLLSAFALILFLAAPAVAHAQLSGYGGGGHGGGGHGGGGYGGGGHGGGGHGGGGHGGGGGCSHGGCGGGGGHGGGGHGGGGRGGDVNIGINISNHASAYAASSAYAAASARGSAYAAQSGFYGGSQSQSIAYGSSFAMGGGYGYGGGCGSSCLGGHVYAPYGPGGPYVTYTVIDSRSYRREYAREESSYGYSDTSGYAYEGGHGYECRSDSRYARREDCDGYSYDSRERGDYVRAYDEGYRSGYSDSYYSRDCDCQVDRSPPVYEAPPPPPPPAYQPEADPYYFPSEPQGGCYRGGSGECG